MSDKQKTAVDLLLDKITDYEMGETLLRLIGKDEIDHIIKVEREQMESHHNEIVEGLKAEIKQSNQENSHNEHTMEWYRHEITELKAEIESLKEGTCKCDSRIGETKLWCCNQCGKRTEEF